MTISIALCTFNGAAFLQEQLQSIAAQTRLPDELVICDDCSHDDTPALLRAFAAQASFPVRLFFNARNIGSNHNFGQAISRCAGEAIALCDQDDVWLPVKLARLESALHQNPRAAMVFSDAHVVAADGSSRHHLLWDGIGFDAHWQKCLRARPFATLLERNIVTGATLMFRSRFAPLLLPFSENGPLIHDAWIAILAAAVAPVLPLAEPLLNYRRHSAQQTHGAGLGPPIRQRAHYEAHLKQLLELRHRLAHQGREYADTSWQVAWLDAKIRHLRARLQLPEATIQRTFGIARELAMGRYMRHSNGWRSAARDLLA